MTASQALLILLGGAAWLATVLIAYLIGRTHGKDEILDRWDRAA